MNYQLQLLDCARCGCRLAFHPTRGWVHTDPQGHPASHVWMRCDACLWEGSLYPTPTRCPSCAAGRDFREDHTATPCYATFKTVIE